VPAGSPELLVQPASQAPPAAEPVVVAVSADLT
jgi:hypothetical protein